MNQFMDYINRNAYKIVLSYLVIMMVVLAGFYVSTIKNDIGTLITAVEEQKDNQDSSIKLVFKGLLIIVSQLEDIAKQQQYIIDQNRDVIVKKTIIVKEVQEKPTYDVLKSHNVFIVGCAGKTLSDEKKIYLPTAEEGKCWSGTAVVIKTTDTETYLLTNNHVSGKGEEDVHLYIENGQDKVEAEIIAQHPTVDAAVLKVNTKLLNKVAIPDIATAKIQDPVYVVGNPLGVKNVYSEGVVAGHEGADLLIQIPCIYGNSGSGVYNQDGKLVGLVYALEVYPGFMGIPEARITHSLVVDSISIKAFLKDLNIYE